jgi:hypothetical protein
MVEEFSATVGMIDRMLELVTSLQQIQDAVDMVQELTNIEAAKRIRAQVQTQEEPTKQRSNKPIHINVSLHDILKPHR